MLKEKAESSAKIERVKKEVGAISSQQTAYEQSNTENLARITGQLGDKASKSEVKQTADGIREEMSQLSKNADEKISAAKTTLEKTAEGLKTDMTAVKSYVADDGKRREELEKYSREETAKQIEAERIKTAENYVGKSQYTEDVKGVNRRFEELSIGGNNLLAYSNFNKNGYYQNGLKRDNNYMYSNLIEVKNTDYLLQIWELKPNAKKLWAGLQLFDEQQNPISNGYSTFYFNEYLKQPIKLPKHARYLAISVENRILDKDKAKFKLELGIIPTDWSPAPEDAETKLAEYKQGVDGQLAAVKQEVNGKVSQTTFDQRANQITQSVQELSNNTVKKSQIKIDENGLVSSSEKTVNGQTLASMISQNPEWVEIIAKLLKIKADMIVNGAITADKLNVKELSALASDLGKVTAGLIDLRKHWVRTSTDDVWGIIHDVTYDTSALLSDSGVLTNGRPGRNKKSDVKPTIMPLTWLNSGELFFANVDSEYDIIQTLANGVYPFVKSGSARIHFGKLEDERDALYIDCEFAELYLNANNYTDWKQSSFNPGVHWKVQGSLVLVDFDLKYDKDGTYLLVGIPQQYVKDKKMFPVQAWSLDRNQDRTAQLNADGSLYIIGANKGVEYHGQIIWTY